MPPVELTLWNWPVTAPLVRFSAVAPATWTPPPETFSVPKFGVALMPVPGPLMIWLVRLRLVDAPASEIPVVA